MRVISCCVRPGFLLHGSLDRQMISFNGVPPGRMENKTKLGDLLEQDDRAIIFESKVSEAFDQKQVHFSRILIIIAMSDRVVK